MYMLVTGFLSRPVSPSAPDTGRLMDPDVFHSSYVVRYLSGLLSLNNHIEMNLDYILSYMTKEGTGERHKIAEFSFSLFLLFLSTKIISVLTLLFKMLNTPFLYFYRVPCSV